MYFIILKLICFEKENLSYMSIKNVKNYQKFFIEKTKAILIPYRKIKKSQ